MLSVLKLLSLIVLGHFQSSNLHLNFDKIFLITFLLDFLHITATNNFRQIFILKVICRIEQHLKKFISFNNLTNFMLVVRI
jgi:hypothetical protein